MRKLILAILLSAPLFSLGAQRIGVHEGQRVRITSMSNKDVVGVVSHAGTDSVVVFIEPSGALLAIATGELRRVDVSRGRSAGEGAKRGAIWGTAVGAGVGLLFSVAYWDNSPNANNQPLQAVTAVTVSYSLLGAIIGTFVKAERWDRVPIGAHI
jgi:hypothetical protein